MNISNLFWHIHYCNGNKLNSSGRKITRTLQHHELILVVEGEGRIVIDQKRYPVKKGMLFYIGPGIPHAIELEKHFVFTVHFSYVRVNFNEGNWNIKREVKMLPLQSAQELKDYYQIEDIFKKLVENWNAKLPGYELITKTLLQQLLIAIYQNIKKQNQNYTNSLKVEKIIQHMHRNISSRLTLAELSDMVQLSPAYLSRVFKETTGYSVIEFFNKIKIDKAKELIIEGNKKVKEVAHILGFADEFYFSRTFKRIEGINPSEFCSRIVHEY